MKYANVRRWMRRAERRHYDAALRRIDRKHARRIIDISRENTSVPEFEWWQDAACDIVDAAIQLMTHVAYCYAHYPSHAPCSFPLAHKIPLARRHHILRETENIALWFERTYQSGSK